MELITKAPKGTVDLVPEKAAKDVYKRQVQSVEKSENDISQYAVIRPFEDLTTVKEVFVITDFPGKGEGEAQLDQGAQTGGEDPE